MTITTKDDQHLTFTDPCIDYGLMVDVYAYDQLIPPLTFYEVNKVDSLIPTELIQSGYDIDMGKASDVRWHFYLRMYQLNSPEFEIMGPFTY